MILCVVNSLIGYFLSLILCLSEVRKVFHLNFRIPPGMQDAMLHLGSSASDIHKCVLHQTHFLRHGTRNTEGMGLSENE